jgi:hypothetical protein
VGRVLITKGWIFAGFRVLGGEWAVEKRIPRGNDRKKSKGNGKGESQYRGLSTALRSGRDDGVCGWIRRG